MGARRVVRKCGYVMGRCDWEAYFAHQKTVHRSKQAKKAKRIKNREMMRQALQ